MFGEKLRELEANLELLSKIPDNHRQNSHRLILSLVFLVCIFLLLACAFRFVGGTYPSQRATTLGWEEKLEERLDSLLLNVVAATYISQGEAGTEATGNFVPPLLYLLESEAKAQKAYDLEQGLPVGEVRSEGDLGASTDEEDKEEKAVDVSGDSTMANKKSTDGDTAKEVRELKNEASLKKLQAVKSFERLRVKMRDARGYSTLSKGQGDVNEYGLGVVAGVSIQLVSFIAIVALLTAMRAGFARAKLEAKAVLDVDVSSLAADIDQCEAKALKLSDESNLTGSTLEDLLRFYETNPKNLETIDPKLRENIRELALTRRMLDQLNVTIGFTIAKNDLDRISIDRIVFGYVFAAISTLSTTTVFLWVTKIEWGAELSRVLLGAGSEGISGYYLALASISCASAAAAFGLLARRRTDDEILISDLSKIGGAAATLPSLLSSVVSRMKG